ncbi:hypothetical protein [Nemorincola caseinilytica]
MKNFDDLFREGLADHAEVPPRRVWESLEKRLDTTGAGAKPTGTGWYWYAGIASVALVVGSIALNMGGKSENTAPATPVATAAVTDNKVTPAQEAAATDMAATENGQKKAVTFRPKATGNGGAAQEDNSATQVSPYGNAPAVGTKLHSYDDFDERAVASAQKHVPAGADDAGNADYKVNKIRKHRLVAAEMVPVGAPAVAAHTPAETVKNTKQPEKAVVARSNPRPATPGGPAQHKPVAGAHGTTKPPVHLAPTEQTQPTAKDATADNSNVAPVQPPVAEDAATTPVGTRPAPVATPTAQRPAAPGSMVAAAKPKPAAGMVTQSKPSTGGSEPARATDSAAQDAGTQEATSNSSSGKKKGFWGIFNRPKKENAK